MDWFVRPGSKIDRLPRPLKPAALLVRNAIGDPFGPTRAGEDGITTIHNIGFSDAPEFKRCYARGVKAAGWDYGIRYRVHQALWCARLAQFVEGDFVELGTGRGFFMSAILESGVARPVHLFDTFLPNKLDSEGRPTGNETPIYAASLEGVRQNFAEWPNVKLHVGNLFDTLPPAGIASVAFLHIDMNHPDPEEFGIRQLWPKMPVGGVMLLDDYASHRLERQFARINSLAREFGFGVLSTPTGQGIVIKA